jgi:hypothetical protein
VELRGAAPIAALGAAADDDLEPARRYHWLEGTAEVYSLPSASWIACARACFVRGSAAT